MRRRYRICRLCGELHDVSNWPDNHRDIPPQRSSLPSPQVVRDGLDDLWHPMDNRLYDSKRAFRKTTQSRGGIEVGTEEQKDRRVYDEVTPEEVATAYKMVEQGYKPRPDTATAEETADALN